MGAVKITVVSPEGTRTFETDAAIVVTTDERKALSSSFLPCVSQEQLCQMLDAALKSFSGICRKADDIATRIGMQLMAMQFADAVSSGKEHGFSLEKVTPEELDEALRLAVEASPEAVGPEPKDQDRPSGRKGPRACRKSNPLDPRSWKGR